MQALQSIGKGNLGTQQRDSSRASHSGREPLIHQIKNCNMGVLVSQLQSFHSNGITIWSDNIKHLC